MEGEIIYSPPLPPLFFPNLIKVNQVSPLITFIFAYRFSALREKTFITCDYLLFTTSTYPGKKVGRKGFFQ